jgi:DNA-binding CsgD family transcriptional regulator
LRIEHGRIPIFIHPDLDAGVAETAAALELARSTGVDVPRAEYLYGTAVAIADQPGGEDALRRAIDTARAAGDTSTEFLAANNMISFNESGGDPQVARQVCREFIDRARELGLGEWQHGFEVALASLDFHAGAYDRVLACEETLAVAMEPRARDQLLEAFCITLVDLGRIDEALRRVDAAEVNVAKDFRGQMQVLWVRTEAALWGGRPERAIEYARRFLAGPAGDPNLPFGLVSLAWARLDLGRDPGDAVPAQARPMLMAIPPEVEGIRALHAGANAQAADHFGHAATLWEPYHRRGEIRCLWAQGEAVRRTGDIDEGVRLLTAAESRAQDLGMLPLLARIHRSLRAAGQRRSAPRTRTAGSILTDRQRQILGLVTEGLTNAEIAQRLGISRHTVVTQLASASAKLGTSSRAQTASFASAELSPR